MGRALYRERGPSQDENPAPGDLPFFAFFFFFFFLDFDFLSFFFFCLLMIHFFSHFIPIVGIGIKSLLQ